jgi:hypothetical protein
MAPYHQCQIISFSDHENAMWLEHQRYSQPPIAFVYCRLCQYNGTSDAVSVAHWVEAAVNTPLAGTWSEWSPSKLQNISNHHALSKHTQSNFGSKYHPYFSLYFQETMSTQVSS